VAGIFYQGLDRANEGLDIAEKSIVAYGGVEVGRLERGLSWISLFIALAPMLGFLGTVVGMIFAFDQIAAANNISPAIVAGGIKVALLTTVFGLIVAIVLQVFYNYLREPHRQHHRPDGGSLHRSGRSADEEQYQALSSHEQVTSGPECIGHIACGASPAWVSCSSS
jgi:hypothetical protein